MSTTQPFSVWLAEDGEDNAELYRVRDAETAVERFANCDDGERLSSVNGGIVFARAPDGHLSKFRVRVDWDPTVYLYEQDVEPHEHGRDDAADAWMDERDERRRMGDG